MAVTGVSNLAELISNQSLGQGQDTPGGAQPVQAQNVGAAVPIQDSFTPSTQSDPAQTTAQDAGLFQVSQSALSWATADALSAQTASPQTAQNAAPAQAAQTVATGTATTQVVPTTAPNIQASVTTSAPAQVEQTIAPDTATTPAPAAAPQVAADVAATATANTHGELQSLNANLLGLGLNNGQIQDIDRIANLTKDFNPTLYTDLVQQFEAAEPQQITVAAAGNQPPTQT